MAPGESSRNRGVLQESSAKGAEGAKKYNKTSIGSDLLDSEFWILSEDCLLTPARPRYLLTPDSFLGCGFAAA